MKNFLLLIIFTLGFSQYYSVNIESTGENTLFIFQDTISSLDIGDEIGLFDSDGIIDSDGNTGELLVGSGIWVDEQLEIVGIQSQDLSQFGGPILPGAVVGHEMMLKVWDVSNQVEFSYLNYDIYEGYGSFNGLFSKISEVYLCDIPEGQCDCYGNQLDCEGVCGGTADLDECGECDGSGIADGTCDCNGNTLDECGVCNGGGAIYTCGCTEPIEQCRDLDGDGWGTSEFTFTTCDVDGDIWVTNCEDLDDSIYCESNENDCAGILCGDTVVDECGTCDGNGIQDYYADWDGDGYGDCDSVYPFCPNDAQSWVSDVCGDCNNGDANAIFNDCSGVCGGSAVVDECGVCNGNNDCFPVAIDGQYTLDEDNQINIYLSATDSDGDALTFSIVNQPSNGTLTLEGVSATYSPNANYNGNDSFTFMANDGQFDSNQATISLTVSAVNDAPYLLDIPDADVESSSVFTYELQAVDVDGDALVYAVTSSGSATATLSGNMLTVTPEYGNNGVTTIAVTVTDGEATDTEEFSLTVFTYGCTGSDSCNYNPDANVDDGSCVYIEDGYCDCYWNIEDCSGECGGNAVEDNCGTCDNDASNDCVQDCEGTWGGDAVFDECGECGGDGTSCLAPGDINGDGIINVLDIVTMVNIVLNDGDYNPLADLNDDGIVNVVDIVALVNIILEQ